MKHCWNNNHWCEQVKCISLLLKNLCANVFAFLFELFSGCSPFVPIFVYRLFQFTLSVRSFDCWLLTVVIINQDIVKELSRVHATPIKAHSYHLFYLAIVIQFCVDANAQPVPKQSESKKDEKEKERPLTTRHRAWRARSEKRIFHAVWLCFAIYWNLPQKASRLLKSARESLHRRIKKNKIREHNTPLNRSSVLSSIPQIA